MIRVWFGHDCPFYTVVNATRTASTHLKTEDYSDPFVIEMLKVIDNVDTDQQGRMTHPIFGAINQSMLSSGVSSLVLALKTDFPIDLTRMGDNCIPFLLDIADKKDVKCVCNRVPKFNKDFTFEDLRSGKIMHTRERFAAYALAKVLEEVDEKRREEGWYEKRYNTDK